ncbi:MAG TPA: isopentenyl-diphosphate Delta-isomerase [Terrimesophilobacter sp.]|nr:isopentenyl-diphosphate Delta-isomerase [Terrimesophilobacter sp.]HRP99350.1 isopentenyl-diphosphate Delta-isomerase [Terrimesophilobacter sp.]
MTLTEEVVLLDEQGQAIGTADKADVHTAHTPLHLAFSCYLLDGQGRLLVTRRALSKVTWPGIWTNSFCGHPLPGEGLERAVERRAEHELDTQVKAIELALPDFRYRATDASGIVENEVCPVYTATLDGVIDPNPAEVSDWEWVDPEALHRSVRETPFAFSPWLVMQLPQLVESGRLARPRSERSEREEAT